MPFRGQFSCLLDYVIIPRGSATGENVHPGYTEKKCIFICVRLFLKGLGT